MARKDSLRGPREFQGVPSARIFREKRFRPLCCESTHFTTLTSRSPGHATSFRKECDRVSCRLKFCSVIRREKGILHAKTEPNPEKWKRKIKRSPVPQMAGATQQGQQLPPRRMEVPTTLTNARTPHPLVPATIVGTSSVRGGSSGLCSVFSV